MPQTLEQKREYDREYAALHAEQRLVRAQTWNEANPDRLRENQRRNRLKKYGITPEQYDAMLESQGGVCALCGGPPQYGRRLSVDHCHETDRVRGLLCSYCNTAISRVEAQPDWLIKVRRYLKWKVQP